MNIRHGKIDEMFAARLGAAQLSANPRGIQWQSAWLHLASPPLQSTLSVFCTPRAVAASILLLDQILLLYKRRWWVERDQKRAKANAIVFDF
jgi:hypothetical protein